MCKSKKKKKEKRMGRCAPIPYRSFPIIYVLNGVKKKRVM